MSRTGVIGVLVVGLFLLGVVGCGDGKPRDGAKTISVDGSSTVFPITEAAASEFQAEKKVKVTVGISGTGGGFKKFVRGETDVQDASRPILKEEMDEAKKNGIEYLELPIAFDAITIVVHKDNDWCKDISIDELKKMWSKDSQGKITKWSEIREGWPQEKFVLYGPGTDSGTFDYFTEAVNGKAKHCTTDFTPSEDDNVLVRGVAGNKYALAYFGYSYYPPNKDKLNAVAISWSKNKTKDPVLPSKDSILDGTYTPLSRPLFLYVNKKALDKPEVKEFVSFYLKNAARLSEKVKYVALPDEAYDVVKKRFEDVKTGTAFAGVPEVGMPIGDILKKEPK